MFSFFSKEFGADVIGVCDMFVNMPLIKRLQGEESFKETRADTQEESGASASESRQREPAART